jgi:cell division protein FtsI/penicillin-binding protein 2
VYEPGSTFKALTIAAALNERTVRSDTVLSCEHGTWHYGGKPLRDFHPYGDLTVADGLKKSSNILAAKVALTLGDERFYRYLRAFGVGSRTGLLLPGEEAGLLRPPRKWSGICSTRIAMGHSVAVTSLQILNIFCTIANGGTMMRPFLVSSVRHRDGTELYRRVPQATGQPIRPETATEMRRLLTRVTERGGTGRRARVEHYEVAGKTGTAEKAVNGEYSGTANVASFVGFLPAADPELGIVVVVDEPRERRTGGQAAAPYFCRIASEAVRYMDIRPSPRRIGDEAPADSGLVARHRAR